MFYLNSSLENRLQVNKAYFKSNTIYNIDMRCGTFTNIDRIAKAKNAKEVD